MEHPVADERAAAADEDRSAGGALRAEILTGAAAVVGLASEWRSLEARAGASVFQSHGFAAAAIGAATSGQPTLITLRRGRALEGLLPLVVERAAGVRVARGLGAPFAQYDDALIDPRMPEAAEAILATVRSGPLCDVLLLRRVPDEGPLGRALIRDGSAARDAAAVLRLEGVDGFEAFLAGLSSTKRKNLRRGRKELEEMGTVAFTVRCGADGLDGALQALEMKRRWLRETGRVSPALSGPAADRLFRDMARTAPEQLAVSSLTVDGRPAAMEIGLVHGARYAAFLGAIDLTYAKASPGSVQIAETIRWCLGEGLGIYDMLPPLDAYKARWTPVSMGVRDHAMALTPGGHAWCRIWFSGLRPLLRGAAERIGAVHRRLRRQGRT